MLQAENYLNAGEKTHMNNMRGLSSALISFWAKIMYPVLTFAIFYRSNNRTSYFYR